MGAMIFLYEKPHHAIPYRECDGEMFIYEFSFWGQ
jgi:hypothetical protein